MGGLAGGGKAITHVGAGSWKQIDVSYVFNPRPG